MLESGRLCAYRHRVCLLLLDVPTQRDDFEVNTASCALLHDERDGHLKVLHQKHWDEIGLFLALLRLNQPLAGPQGPDRRY